jgi:type III secretory pathway component EscR
MGSKVAITIKRFFAMGTFKCALSFRMKVFLMSSVVLLHGERLSAPLYIASELRLLSFVLMNGEMLLKGRLVKVSLITVWA